MNELEDELWREAQQKLPLIKGKKYRIECLTSTEGICGGVYEGIYEGHDATEEFVANNIGAYFIILTDTRYNKIWSRNIIDIVEL